MQAPSAASIAEDLLWRARCALPERISCAECQDFVARVTNWELGLGQPGVRSPNDDQAFYPALAMLGIADVGGSADPLYPEPLPYGDSFWWVARRSGRAYEVEWQKVKLGSRVNRPPRPRGRPRLGPSEREIRAWAADLRAFLRQHVNHRRWTRELRWGHLRRALEEMLPLRAPDYEERLRRTVQEHMGEDRIDHDVDHICTMSKLMVDSLVAALVYAGHVGGEGRRAYRADDVAGILEILLTVDGIAYLSAKQIRRALSR